MDGVSGMLARIKDRASKRRSGLASPVESDVLDPLSVQAASDAMQAPNISGESPVAAAAIRTVSGSGGGGSPFRTAQMTEADEPEVSEVQCEGGMCPPRGGMVISERVIDSPQAVGGMPMSMDSMTVSQGPSLYAPTDMVRSLTAAFEAKPVGERSPADYAGYYRKIATAYQEAMPGAPPSEQKRLNSIAAMYEQQAVAAEQTDPLYREAQAKRANEAQALSLETTIAQHRMTMEKAALPESRMQMARNIVSNANDPLSRSDMRPEARAWLMHNELRNARAKMEAGYEANAKGEFTQDKQELEYLTGMAYAADISTAMVMRERAKMLPLGNDEERARVQVAPLIMAKLRYGGMDQQKRDEALFLELQPALSQRMVMARERELRQQNPLAAISPEEMAQIDQTATGHVMALRNELAGPPQQQWPTAGVQAWAGPQAQAPEPQPQQAPQQRSSPLTPLLSIPSPTL
jgi:hypothetical protein